MITIDDVVRDVLPRMATATPEEIVRNLDRATKTARQCSVCHAEPGEDCVSPSGRVRKVTHTERNLP